MGKKSHRHPLQHENKPSCMWRLIRILDIRSTQKLLPDKRVQNRLAADENPRHKSEVLATCDEDLLGTLASEDCEERMMMTVEFGRTSVKKLMEKEMNNEEDASTRLTKLELWPRRSSSGVESHTKNSHKKCKKSSKQRHKSNKEHSEATERTEIQCQHDQGCKKCGPCGEISTQLNPKRSDVEEKLFKLINDFLIQQLMSGMSLNECEKIQCFEDIRTLQILSSADFPLLDLLKDPNLTPVQDSQRVQDAHLESLAGLKLPGEASELILSNQKQLEMLRRRAENQDKKPLSSPVSDRIVVLKPGGRDSQQSERGCTPLSSPQTLYTGKAQNSKVNANYFLRDIRRKLKRVIRKEHSGTSGNLNKEWDLRGPQNLGSGTEYDGKNPLRNDRLYAEKIAKLAVIGREKNKATSEDFQVNTNTEVSDSFEYKLSDIYVEAKKHLFEMLSQGDGHADSLSRRYPETLGRILSNPNLNRSATLSPQNDSRYGVLGGQMLSSSSKSSFSHSAQSLDTGLNISELVLQNGKVEVNSTNRDQINSEDVSGATSQIMQENCNIIGSHSDLPKLSTLSIEPSRENACASHAKKDSYSNGMDGQPLSLFSSPPSSLTIKRVEDQEFFVDRSDRPSPVSVLEPLFTEDDINLASAKSVDLPMQDLQIQFEEDDFSTVDKDPYITTFEEEKELILDYVRTVLRALNLSWDELYMKTQSSDQLIEPSLMPNVDFVVSLLHFDQQLLFDCINEVLLEVHEYYGRCFPRMSFLKPSIRPIPDIKNAVREVCEGVYWHLLPLPLPRSLEQIVGKDMSKAGWMDLRFDAEKVGVEMSEAIITELMEEIILNFANQSFDNLLSVLPGRIRM